MTKMFKAEVERLPLLFKMPTIAPTVQVSDTTMLSNTPFDGTQ